MQRNLSLEKSLCGNNAGIMASDPNYMLFMMNHMAMETLLLFANDAIGRVEVNKLCRKYGINNAT